MRFTGLLLVLVVAAACHHSSEVVGLYADAFVRPPGATGGVFIPCDSVGKVWKVDDPGLDLAYRRVAARPYQLVYARLQGTQMDEGSVYGGVHVVRVRDIVELRARRGGDCPSIPDSVAHVVGGSAASQ